MKSTMAMLLAIGLMALAGTASAQIFNQVQPDKSRIGFTFSEMGAAVQGGFKRFTATMDFDPARPSVAHASIDIDLASIDAGSQEANDEVLGKPWFDARTYPIARFETTSVRALGANRYEAAGRLTIKGQTRPVVAPFSLTRQGGVATFDGGLTIRRADFGIGEGEWADFGVVANDVRISFHIQAAVRPSGK